MATSLLSLIDDIARLLDDVALMTKVAARRTAGVLGDDLALNAEQVAGVSPARELPVVWAVAKGSALNKLILVPAALAISAFLPWAVTPLLMMGGAFLCFEGFEKVAAALFDRKQEDVPHHFEKLRVLAEPAVDLVALEKTKIRGAIRTDFILSAEIVVITLGTVASASLAERIAVLGAIALLMTVGVYGLVAVIVKLDDAGLALTARSSKLARALGRVILATAPRLLKLLSFAGTIAMFLVGGGILAHGVPGMHATIEAIAGSTGALAFLVSGFGDVAAGLCAGAVCAAGVSIVKLVIRPDRDRSTRPG